MRFPPSPSSRLLPDQTYVELVRSLFSMLLPSVIMSVLFAGAALLATQATADPALVVIGACGLVSSALRLAVVIATRRRGIAHSIVDRNTATRHERLFSSAYLSFALILGLFGARVMMVAPLGMQMVTAALLVGYAAGAAAGISLRPRICGGSMMAAVIPAALVCLASAELFHGALAITLFALLLGGLQNMRGRYLVELEKIEMRRSINGLARRDHLTGLPNRLGFIERFEEATAGHAPDCLIAVHCLDLDRFKAVNDRYGHPVGDTLLRHVANRLAGVLRSGDLASRFGGDEFVVLQCGMQHPDEAELLARRLNRMLGENYVIGDHIVSIGASVGYVVSQCDEPLDALLSRADNALYAVKAMGGGTAAHSDKIIGKSTVGQQLS